MKTKDGYDIETLDVIYIPKLNDVIPYDTDNTVIKTSGVSLLDDSEVIPFKEEVSLDLVFAIESNAWKQVMNQMFPTLIQSTITNLKLMNEIIVKSQD